MLPLALTGHELLPASATILAFALLPVAVGIAIVRVEFLGITALARRRTLRALVGAAGLGGVVTVAEVLVTAGARRWDWPAPAVTVGVGLLAALGAVLLPALMRRGERLALHDAYDSAMALGELGRVLDQNAPAAAGPVVVARLTTMLDLTDALLLTPHAQWAYTHPRTADPVATQEAVVERARRLCVEERRTELADDPAGRAVLFVPLRAGPDARAMLCLGPKRGGAPYTRQDHALLDDLSGHLALVLSQPHGQARLAPHNGAAPVATDRPLTEDGLVPDRGVTTPDPRPSLTPRELEVLKHLVEGRTNKEIAGLLICSEKTVQGHNTNIFAKLDARNRTEAATKGRRTGLLRGY